MEKIGKEEKGIRTGVLLVVVSVLLGANVVISGAGLWLTYNDSRTTQTVATPPADTVDVLSDLNSADRVGQTADFPAEAPSLVKTECSQERIRESLARLRETSEVQHPVADRAAGAGSDASNTSYPDFVRTEDGMTLRNLARRYYGSEVFWVCIYDHNSDLLHTPDVLPLGIRLSLPHAADYGIDAGDPSSLRRARALAKNLARL